MNRNEKMHAFMMPRPPRPGSKVGCTYSIPIESLNDADLQDEKKRLTLQAKSNFGPPELANHHQQHKCNNNDNINNN